ncbi:hypothetical protein A1D31_36470 [Bradyrhizobium liaoningense]|nr:hypothetical protein A1D31_36470 [Bradyrhizobium liaoningense]
MLTQLAANGAATRAAQNAGKPEPDHIPVVKVFNPYGGATWLLTESDPDEPDRLYGLCDLGMGEPELGYVARSEIESVRVNIGGHGLPLERDMYFKTDKPLSAFYEVARRVRRIEA